MNIEEKIVFAIRHNKHLEHAGWLWNGVRPVYDRVSAVIGRKGLKRTINNTDKVLVAPQWRMVPEEYEPEVWRQIIAQVMPGDMIADVGAYIGLYTVALAKRTGPSGRVVAFEPDPANFVALKEHVELNGVTDRVELREAAVGQDRCPIIFAVQASSESFVIGRADAEVGVSGYTIECVTLDHAFAERRMDILKVDVEGYEEKVIQGAASLLQDPSRCPRVIFIEVHPYAWQAVGTTSESLLRLLAECNYRVQDLAAKPVERIEHYGEIIAYKWH